MSVTARQPVQSIVFAGHGNEHDIEFETNWALVIQHLRDTVGVHKYTNSNDPAMFHRVGINFDDVFFAAKSTAFLRYLIHPENEHLRNGVREVHITGSSSLNNSTLLESAFAGLRYLETVHWELSAPIPPSILRSLETENPSARLHYTLFFSDWDAYDENNPPVGVIGVENDHDRRNMGRQSILNSTNLYSLKGQIEYGGSPNQDDMRLVWQILTTCPKLRELDLSLDHRGCLVTNGQPWSFDFLSNPEARIPPLEVLKLDGYAFASTDNDDWKAVQERKSYNADEDTYSKFMAEASFMFKSIRREILQLLDEGLARIFRTVKQISLRPEEKKRTNLEDWMEAMDWSKLHTLNLKLGSGFFLDTMKDNLPSLKHIKFQYVWDDDSVRWEDRLANISSPLESLHLSGISWKSIPRIIDAITSHHGSTLKHLGLTCGCQRQFLNRSTISHIRDTCPILETLDFEIDRNKTWNYPFLHELMTLPKLRQLTLRFPGEDWADFLQNNNMDPEEAHEYNLYNYRALPDDSLINISTVVGLYRYLRRYKKEQKLEKLAVIVSLTPNRYQDWRHGAYHSRASEYKCFVDGFGFEVCEEISPERQYWDFDYP